MSYCPSCGASIEENQKYCSNCGKKVAGLVWHPKNEDMLTTVSFLLGTLAGFTVTDFLPAAMIYGVVLAVIVWIAAFLKANIGERNYRDTVKDPILSLETASAMTGYPLALLVPVFLSRIHSWFLWGILLLPVGFLYYRKKNKLTSSNELWIFGLSFFLHVFFLVLGVMGLIEHLVRRFTLP